MEIKNLKNEYSIENLDKSIYQINQEIQELTQKLKEVKNESLKLECKLYTLNDSLNKCKLRKIVIEPEETEHFDSTTEHFDSQFVSELLKLFI